MRVKFKSNDDLSLDKILSFSNMIIVVGSVIKKDKKYYPQVYLHECLYQFVNELCNSCTIYIVLVIFFMISIYFIDTKVAIY